MDQFWSLTEQFQSLESLAENHVEFLRMVLEPNWAVSVPIIVGRESCRILRMDQFWSLIEQFQSLESLEENHVEFLRMDFFQNTIATVH